jgi:hypothetical protein|tara:strand:- start:2378 stop:2653 length:276 start_codon:yes stop_codon:yes gene_type:complete
MNYCGFSGLEVVYQFAYDGLGLAVIIEHTEVWCGDAPEGNIRFVHHSRFISETNACRFFVCKEGYDYVDSCLQQIDNLSIKAAPAGSRRCR